MKKFWKYWIILIVYGVIGYIGYFGNQFIGVILFFVWTVAWLYYVFVVDVFDNLNPKK